MTSTQEQPQVPAQPEKPAEQPSEPQPQPPQVDIFEQIKTLTDEEKNLCPAKLAEFITSLYTKGLIYKLKDKGVKHLPLALYPSPIPKNLFEKIFFYQIAFNKILNKLSNDQAYIEKILEPIAASNNFVQKLLEISKKSLQFEKKQKIKLCVFRNDYLLDKDQKFLFLQEFKTSSVDLGSYTNILLNFHNYFKAKYPTVFAKFTGKDKEIPENKGNTIEKISEAILEAIKLAFPQIYKDTVIVFVTQKKFDFDLENLVNVLYDTHQIKSVKLSLSEINKKLKKDEEGNLLLEDKKVSLVYFNSGDKEEDYPDEDAWNGRELVELSTAIKVPDINTFLASHKIFQYFLSKPDVIMHYNYNELILNDILRFFGGIYFVPDLAKDKQTELFTKIQADPNKFILKSFSGPKNYITGEKLKSVVPAGDAEPSDELKNGIIVECCVPPEHETLIVKDEVPNVESSVSEYSIYGIILMNEKNLVMNKSVSYLVKTRNKDNLNDFESFLGDENGKIAVDLPCLVDTKWEPNLSHKVEIKAEEIQKYLDDLKAAEEEAKRKKEEEEKKKAEEEAKKKAEEEEAKKKEEEEKAKAAEEKKEEPKTEA
jgi:glutathione synthase